MKWRSAQATHPGKIRPNNEDSVLDCPDRELWAVADGMGGHSAGDVASQTITRCLERLETKTSLVAMVDYLDDTLVATNDSLRAHGRQSLGGSTIGSTVVTMVARESVGVVLWAGDSRLYRCRAKTLEQITRDHNPISDLLDGGGVTEAQAQETDTHVITRAVGGQSDLFLDLAVFDIAPGDTYLLCSDGLYRELGEAQLCSALTKSKPEKIVSELLSRGLAGPARDNISLVVARAEARG